MLINEIIPYEKNARHNEKAIPVVADSIREFGLRGQIVLESRDNPVIVTGHTRVAACKSLGYTTRNADRFKKDLLEGLRENKAFVYTPNKRGDVSISVIMELGVTRKEEVVTAWAIEAGSKNPHLVTAYPRKRKR